MLDSLFPGVCIYLLHYTKCINEHNKCYDIVTPDLTNYSIPAPSISSVEVMRLNGTTFNLSVSLAYTGGGAITHFRVSSRNTGTTPWSPLEDIPVTPSPNSSLVWNGVVSRDEFAAYYQVEFLLSVTNQDGFESNSSQAEIDLGKFVVTYFYNTKVYMYILMHITYVVLYDSFSNFMEVFLRFFFFFYELQLVQCIHKIA